MNLEQSRKAIDEIDQQLVKLFTERMACAAEIAAYKKENNLPVLDAGRERQKLAAISEMAPDDLENSARCLYSLIFSLSRAYQHRLLGNDAELPKKIAAAIEATPNLFPPKAMVACQGLEGAYSRQSKRAFVSTALFRSKTARRAPSTRSMTSCSSTNFTSSAAHA